MQGGGNGTVKSAVDLVDGSQSIASGTVRKVSRTGGTWSKKYQIGGFFNESDIRHWDNAPTEEYFNELFRVSKLQIIWGGNYFGLPPNRNFIIWKKLTISESFSMAMAEYAWTNKNGNSKIFEYAPQDKNRIHPTQKPVALYNWLLERYANPGDKILDTHIGSGSSRIACYDLGFDFYGTEFDKEYFGMMEERFRNHTAQGSLFEPGELRG